jgi:hypothetical protein
MMLVAPVTALVALWQSPKRHGEDSVTSLAADAVRAKLRRIIRENTQ